MQLIVIRDARGDVVMNPLGHLAPHLGALVEILSVIAGLSAEIDSCHAVAES